MGAPEFFENRFDGRVAYIAGAARGQGRSHAVRMAREGATLALLDICAQADTVAAPMARPEDLAETVRLCKEAGAEVISVEADIRDYDAVSAFADEARSQFGKIDVLIATAGIYTGGEVAHIEADVWQEMIDINLTGIWHTVKATVPEMEKQGYGRVVLTASAGGVIGFPGCGHYCAAKHGVVGLTRTLAQESGKAGVTVNVLCPTSVLTPMIENPEHYAMLGAKDLDGAREVMSGFLPMGLPWVYPEDVTAFALFLASEEARYVNGGTHLIDMGQTAG